MSLKKMKYGLYRKLPATSKGFMAKKRKGYQINVRFAAPYQSQFGQDRVVNEVVFKGKANGFFVDIGANDGETGSNTAYFERSLDWTGICVEPQPDIFAELQRNRNCEMVQCCITDKPGTMKFLKVAGANMLSGLVDLLDEKHKARIEKEEDKAIGSETIDVECRTFSDVLGDRTQIDYLNIDTEGAEMSILKCIDFKRYNIGCITVENNYDDPERFKLLERNGFKLLLVAGDEVYVNQSIASGIGPFDEIQKALS
ncbi:MAG TPA: hypothetical protein DHW42_04490 [Candidatus Marinimicrobia bacterium]|nr:hypothetical protein [Candidatus Neomarinimicrobiota bacterium]